MTAAVQRTAATISFITVPPEGPRPTDLTQMNAGLRPDYRCADTTNAMPNPLAPLDERPHRDAHLRSAARHCHPPITRPSFMSRLERIRTLPVVYGGNRAGLFVALALVTKRAIQVRLQFDCGSNPYWKTGERGRIFPKWRQLSDVTIAAPSTIALTRSSWCRTLVTHPVRSAVTR